MPNTTAYSIAGALRGDPTAQRASVANGGTYSPTGYNEPTPRATSLRSLLSTGMDAGTPAARNAGPMNYTDDIRSLQTGERATESRPDGVAQPTSLRSLFTNMPGPNFGQKEAEPALSTAPLRQLLNPSASQPPRGNLTATDVPSWWRGTPQQWGEYQGTLRETQIATRDLGSAGETPSGQMSDTALTNQSPEAAAIVADVMSNPANLAGLLGIQGLAGQAVNQGARTAASQGISLAANALGPGVAGLLSTMNPVLAAIMALTPRVIREELKNPTAVQPGVSLKGLEGLALNQAMRDNLLSGRVAPRGSPEPEPDPTEIADITDPNTATVPTVTEPDATNPNPTPAPDVNTDVSAPAATTDPDANDTGGAGVSNPDGSGPGGTGGGGGGDGGGGCYLVNWALDGLGGKTAQRDKAYLDQVYRQFVAAHPRTAKQQIKNYQSVAGRILVKLKQSSPEVQQWAMKYILAWMVPQAAEMEIVDRVDVDRYRKHLRTVVQTLRTKLGVQVPNWNALAAQMDG